MSRHQIAGAVVAFFSILIGGISYIAEMDESTARAMFKVLSACTFCLGVLFVLKR